MVIKKRQIWRGDFRNLFRSSPNTEEFYTFYISQGSVATQLRCDGMFSNHFTTNFSQNVPVKKF